jgi:Ribose/xylose/arabinose/galactoside ABC-type transport systems, permease components
MGEAAGTGTTSNEQPGGLAGLVRATVARPEFVAFVALIVLMVLTASMNENFFTTDNLLNITRQVSVTGIVAVGMTFVILTGGIDLSVGAIVALASTLMAGMIADFGLPFWLAALLAVIGGALTGAVSGFFIARFSLPPIIVTWR